MLLPWTWSKVIWTLTGSPTNQWSMVNWTLTGSPANQWSMVNWTLTGSPTNQWSMVNWTLTCSPANQWSMVNWTLTGSPTNHTLPNNYIKSCPTTAKSCILVNCTRPVICRWVIQVYIIVTYKFGPCNVYYVEIGYHVLYLYFIQ